MKKYKLEQIDKKIEELNKKKQEILAKQETDKLKVTYTKIPELNIMISNQVFNGKTYEEILTLVPENQIVTHDILFKLRSMTDKYPQFNDFWVYVPNPDKISRDNNYVAGFCAGSGRAVLVCGGDPSDTGPALGVFLYKKYKKNDLI